MQLYEFQKIGVDFLVSHQHAMLADEMGLGKSIQACVALKKIIARRVLIICPAIIKMTWVQYLDEWFDSSCTIHVINHRKADIKPTETWAGAIIVNYELLLSKHILDQLLKMTFAAVIVDEAHRLKNISSKTSKIILGTVGKRPPLISRGNYKWLLTGSPMPNRPIELFPALRTLAPDVISPYNKLETYGKHFCAGFEQPFGGYDFSGASHVEELRIRLKPFMLRREIKEVYQELPDKIVTPIYCELPDLGISDADTPLATLRKAIGIAKVEFTVSLLKDKLGTFNKVVCFGYTRNVIEQLTDHEQLAKFNPVHIYGGMSAKDKDFALKYFIENNDCKLIILQIRSAGEAVDGLQKVSNCIVFAELEWSAGKFDQAISRLHRIGQENILHIFPIIAKNTLDEKVIGSYHKKKKVINKLINNAELPPSGLIYRTAYTLEKEMSIEASLERIASSLEHIEAIIKNDEQALAVMRIEKQMNPPVLVPDQPKRGPGRPPGTGTKKGDSNGAVPNEEEIRRFALQITKECPDGETEGRLDVTRVLAEFGCKKISEVPKEELHNLVASFKRILGTYAQDADSSDDLGDM